MEASIPASPLRALCRTRGAISIQSGAFLLTLQVYQIHSLGKKKPWLEQGLVVFQSQVHWPSGGCAVKKDGQAGRGV